MAYSPPPSFTDALDDCKDSTNDSKYSDLELPFGTFKARKPMPKAVGALGSAVNAKISASEQSNYVGLFVQNHMSSDSFDDLIEGLMTGRYPEDAVQQVNEAIVTWGTARPTRRS